MGSGIHIVWGVYRIFYLYQCQEKKTFYFRLVIWSWYIGAILGNCCAGFVIPKFRKGHLYVSKKKMKLICYCQNRLLICSEIDFFHHFSFRPTKID